MATQAVNDLLDSRVLGNGGVVTYRSVARELKLSADDAKAALKDYLGASEETLWATYVVAGDDVDGNHKFIIVPQEALEVTKGQFTSVSNVHLYSISKTPRKDASMITQVARALRHNSTEKPKPAAARPKAAVAKPAPAPKAASVVQKPKATGKLDFSKAKVKTAPKVEEKSKPVPAPAVKKEVKPTVVPKASKPVVVKNEPKPTTLPPKTEAKPKPPPKAPTPEPEPSGEEDRPVAGGSRLKRKMVISDDEDDEPPQPTGKTVGKRKVVESDDEEDGMEVDDEDAPDMYEDTEPMVKTQRKRQVKTTVPMGRNGRPKKRIVKERMIKGDDGYMQNEDYSEYETDHDEPKEEPPKPKVKEAKPKPAPAPAKPKPAPKKVTGKPGQSKLTNFLKK